MNTYVTILWCFTLATLTYGFKKMDCHTDATIAQNATCTQTKTRQDSQVVYGVTLLKPVYKIWIRVAQMKRNSANQYQPGAFDVTKDVCSLSSPINYQFLQNFINMLEPGHFDKYKDLLHPCPYSGRIEVRLPYKGPSGVGGSVMGRGDYKTVVRIYNEANQTIFGLNTYYSS